jgi:hypothetical protein
MVPSVMETVRVVQLEKQSTQQIWNRILATPKMSSNRFHICSVTCSYVASINSLFSVKNKVAREGKG